MKPVNAQQKKQIMRRKKRKKKGGEKAEICLPRMPDDNIQHLDSA